MGDHYTLIRSPSPNKRHLRRHHGNELHVGLERKAGHVDHGASNIVDIHRRLDFDRAVGLRHTLFHARRHIGRGIANVDLAAGDVVFAPIEGRRFGQPGDGVFGGRIGR